MCTGKREAPVYCLSVYERPYYDRTLERERERGGGEDEVERVGMMAYCEGKGDEWSKGEREGESSGG